MKFRFLVVSLIVASRVVAGCANDATRDANAKVPSGTAVTARGETNFASEYAGFSIYFPTKPSEKRTPGQSQWGRYDTYVFQSETKPVSYIVVVRTNPPLLDKSNAQSLIDGLEKSFTSSPGSRVQKRRDISLNGAASNNAETEIVPGREIVAEMRNGAIAARVRIFSSPRASYQIVAVGNKKEFAGQNAQIEKVLNSFRLTT